jgi:type IV pilus secretin PilQ/predicted competence protein
MTRGANGFRAVWAGLAVGGVFLFTGCARAPVLLEEEGTRTEAHAAPAPASATSLASDTGASEGALDATTMQIREIKLISDNGQQGIFAKLTRPPQNLSHFTLVNPNRLVIELEGNTSAAPSAAQYPVDDPVVRQIRVSSDEGKIRVTATLADGPFPSYTVDELDDTLVAFLGEPRGTAEPIHEQIVFTQRAVPGALQPPAPMAPAEAVVAAPEVSPAVNPAEAEVSAKAPQAVASAAEATAPEAAPLPKSTAPEVVPPVRAPAPLPPRAAPSNESMGETKRQGRIPGQPKLYYGQPISLDLKDADINNVFRLLAEVSNLNIVATDDVQGRITLRLYDVPWDQVLDIVLHVMNLESTQEGNVLRISSVKRLREEREEMAKALEAQRIIEPLQVAYIRVNYAKAQKIAELISGAARVQGRGGTSRGGRGGRGTTGEEETGILTLRGSVMVDEFTNTLVVRDVAEGIQNARDLVRRLDVQIPQVLIESSIVEATTTFARDLGVQWGYSASIGPQTGNTTGFNFPGSIGLGGASLGTGTGGIPFIADFPAGGNFKAGNGSGLDLALGSLDGSQSLNVRITALEEQGKARVISRPRVATLNNVAATIKSLTVIRVRLPSTGTVINTGAGGAAGGSQTGTEKIETGIILVVTPQVSSDGFVLLDMFAKSSQADFTQTVDNIPTEITREATSHVLVRDGQTVVLGGIYRDSLDNSEGGVPFFNNIPGLRWLFKTTSNNTRREDLLIFLTPRILGGTGATQHMPSASDLWNHRGSEDRG